MLHYNGHLAVDFSQGQSDSFVFLGAFQSMQHPAPLRESTQALDDR